MIILAHRGWWTSRRDHNSLEAFRSAFEAGLGVELDLRDFGGHLVISHDVPVAQPLSLESVLALHARYPARPWLAINIKSDGLAQMLAAAAARWKLANYFTFDMSVPDALHYLRAGVPAFTRYSEYETVPSFYREASGIWLDAFHDPWGDPERIVTYLRAGKRVALVSPELHGRPHAIAWNVWKKALSASGLPEESIHERLMLCTDFPADARTFFAKAEDFRVAS